MVTPFPRAYLEVHQQEQEKLQRQIKESKRNSRLVSEGFASCMPRINMPFALVVWGAGQHQPWVTSELFSGVT